MNFYIVDDDPEVLTILTRMLDCWIAVAARAKVKRLHLFHHDPDQTDDDIDAKLRETRQALERLGAGVSCDAPVEAKSLSI